ncbi:MAG TPA: EamA family transporter [Candidatus Limnocylindrales bacterium]
MTATGRSPVRSPAIAIWAGLLILYLVWGSTYLGIRIAIETIPPLLMAGFRFLLAGGILYAISIARGEVAVRPSLAEWRDATIVGALLMVGGMGLVALGEQTVPSGIAALLVAVMPVWLAIVGRVAFGQRLPLAVVAGIALGLAGVAILAWPAGADGLEPLGVLALIASPLSWAIGSLFVAHRARLPRSSLLGTAMQMLAGGVLLTILGLARGELTDLRLGEISVESIVAVAYLTFIGSLLAFTVFGWLVRVAPLSLIGTYAYVNPVVAVLLGAVFVAEPITPRTIVAAVVIVVAVAIIVTARGRMSRAGAPANPGRETPDPERRVADVRPPEPEAA